MRIFRSKLVVRGCLLPLLALAILATAGIAIVYVQGTRKPSDRAQYVALGSSFAAGKGLGTRSANSPFLCGRGADNYPSQVARQIDLALTDVSCGGATAAHVLRGGQLFQRAQVDAINADTQLITLTVGGNDVAYVGDLMTLAARGSQSWVGVAARFFSNQPRAVSQRDFAGVTRDIAAIVATARQRAPRAQIIVVTYPAILPPNGTCKRLGLNAAEVTQMRAVSDRLAEATRLAASATGARLVDMDRMGVEHHACAKIPWVNGWEDPDTTAFHPTAAGAAAIARGVIEAYRHR